MTKPSVSEKPKTQMEGCFRKRHGPLLIRGGLLVSSCASEARRADLLINDGYIERVLDSQSMAPDPVTEVFDATGLILIPGLINAHSHSSGNLVRSLSDHWNLELQLNAGPAFRGKQQDREKYLATLIGALEAVSRGCTACYDFFYEFPLPSAQGLRQVARAYEDVGMRAVIAPMVSDISFYDAVPGLLEALPDKVRQGIAKGRPSSWTSIMASMEDILVEWDFDWERVRLGVAPTIPLHCSDDFLKAACDFAHTNSLTLHTHLAESKVQAISALRKYGTSITQHLYRLGLLTETFTGAHGVWIDQEDIRTLAGQGASIAHNPGANMRLGVGVAKVRDMLAGGLSVGLGTDSRVCSDNLNMFEAMRLASFSSRLHGYDHRAWLSTREAFSLATDGSAKILGFASKLGRLEPGYKADIVFLDAQNTNYIPLINAMNQIVHAEDATSVLHVMVDGDFVYFDRAFPGIDVRAVNQEVQQASDRLRTANAEALELAQELELVVSSFCGALASQPHHIHRFVGQMEPLP